MTPNPRSLLARYRSGDASAGPEICRTYLPVVRAVALAATLDLDLATAAAEGALGAMLARLPEAETAADLFALAEETARKTARDRVREAGGRTAHMVGIPAEAAARARLPLPDLPEVFGDLPPDRAGMMLLEAATWIPAQHQVPFLLRYAMDLDPEAIGTLAGTTPDEVVKTLAAARRLFDREIGFQLRRLAGT